MSQDQQATANTQTQTPPTQALARTDVDRVRDLAGSYRDAKSAASRMMWAGAHPDLVHLVTPSTVIGALPEGFGVNLARVDVNVEHETYSVAPGGDDDGGRRGGKRGLSKSALERIARAAGVSWDVDRTRRLDDGSDPRYCLFLAVGRVRQLDGTEVDLQGTKEMDLRDGSPQIEALQARAKRKGKDATTQIRELRLHILAHAESKAKLRAIRSLGIRSAYTPEELKKPFFVASLMFTGETNDPELRREFAMLKAKAALGGIRALYGCDSNPFQRELMTRTEARAALPTAVRPPPITNARALDEDDELELEPEPTMATPAAPAPTGAPTSANADPSPTGGADRGESSPPANTAQTPPKTTQVIEPPAVVAGEVVAPSARPVTADAPRAASGFTIPGGRAKDTPLESAEQKDLTYWLTRIDRDLADDTSKFPNRDAELAEAIRAELARRDDEKGGR